MNKTVARHLSAITAGTVDKTNIIGLRKIINAWERASAGWSRNGGTQATDDEIEALEDAISEHHPRVTGELHETGVKVLRNPRYRRRLESYSNMIDALDHFELRGFERIGPQGRHAVPIYRAVAANGLGFDFINIPWQSGGNGPEVLQ